MQHRRLPALVIAVLSGLIFVVGAHAQVGSALVAVPWQPGRTFDSTSYFYGLETSSEGTDFDTNLTKGVTFGRARFDGQNPAAMSVGWLYEHTDIDTDDPLLPDRLVSAAGAVGFSLGPIVPGWEIGASVGAGFAGDQPFSDEDAWYGVGSLYARHMIDQQHFVTLILDYDGSRSIWPDIPLPGIQYTVLQSRSLRYSVGLPFSTLYYQPDEHWTIDIQYIIPVAGRANIEYAFNDRWTAFGSYASSTRGYHLDGDDENRRLFFSQQRLETGVRYTMQRGVEWTLAGGWDFDQEFTRGWDTRNDEDVRELDDAPFVRVGLKVAF